MQNHVVSFQVDADEEVVVMLGKQIVADYQQQKVFQVVICYFFSAFSLCLYLPYVFFFHF